MLREVIRKNAVIDIVVRFFFPKDFGWLGSNLVKCQEENKKDFLEEG